MTETNYKDGLVEALKYDDPDKIIKTVDGPIKYIDYLKKKQRQIMSRKDGYAYLDEHKGKYALLVYDKNQDRTIRKV